MYSFGNLFEPMLTDKVLVNAFVDSAKGKFDHKRVQKVLYKIEQHLIILKHKLETNTWKPRNHSAVCINEHTCQKKRTIIKPDYKYEQVVHHAVMKMLSPCIMRGMYEYSCGSIPKRGVHYGKKAIKRWLNDIKGTTHVVKMDITHFFQSINQRKLLRWLRKKIRDTRFFNLLELIIHCVKKGIPLGFYTSQWFANFMLQPLDHFIKEKLHVKKFIRYMDDMVMFFSSKREAHHAMQAVGEFLKNQFGLRLKGDRQVFKFDFTKRVFRTNFMHFKVAEKIMKVLNNRGLKAKMKGHKNKTYIEFGFSFFQSHKRNITKVLDKFNATVKEIQFQCGRKLDFMGFVFSRTNITLRKGIMLRSTRKVNKVAKKDRITWYDASAILSYLGWYKHADVYNVFLDMIKPLINVKKLRRLLSSHSRKERYKYDGLEACRRYAIGYAT